MAVSENTRTLPVARRRAFAALGLLAATPAEAMAGPATVAAPVTAYRLEPHSTPGIALALAELRAIDADRLAIEQSGHSLPRGVCPATRAQEAVLSAVMDRFYGAVGTIAEATAVTFGDFQAKAEALSIALRLLTFGGHAPEDTANGTLQERLAWSLCRDLLDVASAGTPKGA